MVWTKQPPLTPQCPYLHYVPLMKIRRKARREILHSVRASNPFQLPASPSCLGGFEPVISSKSGSNPIPSFVRSKGRGMRGAMTYRILLIERPQDWWRPYWAVYRLPSPPEFGSPTASRALCISIVLSLERRFQTPGKAPSADCTTRNDHHGPPRAWTPSPVLLHFLVDLRRGRVRVHPPRLVLPL